jgi:hypothetical protein
MSVGLPLLYSIILTLTLVAFGQRCMAKANVPWPAAGQSETRIQSSVLYNLYVPLLTGTAACAPWARL